MTPLEELQAAHKRLSQLAEESGGAWARRTARGPERRLIDDEFGACRADVSTSSDADLIVTLHRTIDAQVLLLSEAMEDYEGVFVGDCPYPPHALTLARAINGGVV